MSYYQFNRQEVLQKAKDRYHNCGGKEKAAKYYIKNKEIFKKMQTISIETCQKKKKKQNKNMERIDIET